VRTLVVDDGSRDDTAGRAAAAGAEVVSTGPRGLGAAVRRGLAEGLARGAVAVAFCDADGEYDPAELERLVAPILGGDADYVVGSRFAGGPRRMRRHRLAGNVVLTAALSIVAGRRLSDGQSGDRALSAPAAAAAEIGHDYNYAQLLTLDLLAKGFRYAEVPISYRHRTEGESFVRLGAYLRHVVPATWRLVRSNRSVLHHVRPEALPAPRPRLRVERAVAAQCLGGGPAHGERMVGVVGDEQALAAEGDEPWLGPRPELERGDVPLETTPEHGIHTGNAADLDLPAHQRREALLLE
jgi:hypothetical protein